jgi:CRISPR type III-B/RAMP module RAMP protein Cmr1
MKELYNGKIEFVTPSFLAGADQNHPEVRVSAIRGELRWWFRVLGGTSEEENLIFGTVHGSAMSSAIILRVTDVAVKYADEIKCPVMSDIGYIYYFAQVSGKRENVHRTFASHYFAPGTSFRLVVGLRREIDQELENKFRLSLRIFVALGSLGLRATRGCGAIAEESGMARNELRDLLSTCEKDLTVRLIGDEAYGSAAKCQTALGGFLREFRRKNRLSGKTHSALGYSDGRERASSALRLRPVKIGNDFLPAVIYTDAACSQPSVWDLVIRETIEI